MILHNFKLQVTYTTVFWVKTEIPGINITCNMNAFVSFDLFVVYIPECKYEIIHADTRYCIL
jgi:hypothetical protein